MSWQDGLCIVCGRGKTLPHQEWCRRVAEANRKANLAANPKFRTHCPWGHEYTDENTYVYEGSRQCRACCRVDGRHTIAAERARRVEVSGDAA